MGVPVFPEGAPMAVAPIRELELPVGMGLGLFLSAWMEKNRSVSHAFSSIQFDFMVPSLERRFFMTHLMIFGCLCVFFFAWNPHAEFLVFKTCLFPAREPFCHFLF